MDRNAVITGLGIVTGFGVGHEALWQGLVEGRSAIGPIEAFDASQFDTRLAAMAPEDFTAKDFVPKSYRKAVKIMARDTHLAVAAASLAVGDGKIRTRALEGEGGEPTYAGERIGCQIGAGLIAAETKELTSALIHSAKEGDPYNMDWRKWGEGAMYKLQPLWLLKYLPNMLACHVTILHGAEGPSNTITCAEASGLLSIGESTRVIERGDVEMCFSGGAESRISYVGLARMRLTGWLAPTGDETNGAKIIRPYDPDSPGGLLGEGGGILILEESNSARERGAHIYATIDGFGAGQSPPPVMPTMPPPIDEGGDAFDGAEEGLVYAIENAFEDAGIGPDEIDAIVPRAMGMPSADMREANTFRAIFGERVSQIPIIATSPAVGNCMAASGPINVAVAARCLESQSLPARLNAGSPAGDLDAGPEKARSAALRRILVCSGSIGGQNAAVIVGRAPN